MHSFYNLNPNHQPVSSETSSSVSLDVNTPLSNDEFNHLFNEYSISPTEETQNNLGMHLNRMNFLIGIISDDSNASEEKPMQITIKKGDDLKFLICSNTDREVFLPIFTDDTEVAAFCQEPINTLIVPAVWLWKFILNQKNYTGVLINPSSISWQINQDHIQSLLDDIE